MAPWDHRPRQHTAALCSRRYRERLVCCVIMCQESWVTGYTNSWIIQISRTLRVIYISRIQWVAPKLQTRDLSQYHKLSEPCESHKLSELSESPELNDSSLITHSLSHLHVTNSLPQTNRLTARVSTDSNIKCHELMTYLNITNALSHVNFTKTLSCLHLATLVRHV